jgi:hypothetical protein
VCTSYSPAAWVSGPHMRLQTNMKLSSVKYVVKNYCSSYYDMF